MCARKIKLCEEMRRKIITRPSPTKLFGVTAFRAFFICPFDGKELQLLKVDTLNKNCALKQKTEEVLLKSYTSTLEMTQFVEGCDFRV